MTIGMALVACFALLFAAVKTEVRMYVHQKGDAWNTTVNSVDSVKFRDDEVDGKTVERIHVFRKGEASAWSAATENVDSIDFRWDTLRYLVTFMDGETLLSAKKYDYGTMPECEFPVSESSRLKTYDFFWNPKLTLVVDDATYILDSTLIYYKYRFVDYNGEILKDTAAAYNYEPKVSVLPIITRDSIFTFKEWVRDESKIADTIIVLAAVYDTAPHLYTRMYYNCDTLFAKVERCTYDSVVEMTDPTRKRSDVYKYDFNSWTLDESKIALDTLIYTAKYDSTEHGMLTVASFKISDTKSVYFSKGNLQFTTQGSHKTADSTAKGTWRFAENQWDVIGDGNANIAEDYTGWIDLFGWGTSGWSSKANAYQPWATSESNSDYYPGGIYSNSLTGTYANADWGVFNAISNGGDEPSKWRTLTNAEWKYLFQNNKWTLGYIKTTEKDSSLCFMLIPETFTAPEGITVTALSTTTTSTYLSGLTVPSTNKYTTEQFASLEKLGVVALPCGGYRDGTSMSNVGSDGYYWSSSAYDSYYAYEFYFYSTSVYSDYYYYYTRRYGRSVRLVQDLNLDIHFVNADGTTLLDTTVARGATPTYTREEPTMVSTKAYTYVFKGWNKEIVAAESDMVYTAVYDSTSALYTSVFKNYDGTSLDTIKKCAYDSVTKVEPTREANLRYFYSFDGWSRGESQVSDGILVYTAVYDSTPLLYTSIFKNYDGTSLDTIKKCAYDSVINGKELTHRDAYNRYDFNSWTRDEGKIARDTLVYTAVYDTTKILYTQLYYNCDTLFKKFENCAYDYVPTMKTPNRDSTDYAYNFTGWSKDTSKIARDTLIYTAVYDSTFIMKKNGAIRYAYKISATDSVYFSQGNLQFNAVQGSHTTADGYAKGTWRFAENQYDYIGSANSNISETYEGWIDLFGWGTSGWNSGANAYQPWATSSKYSDYKGLTGNYEKSDWGVFNAISNGGNEPNRWRTLSRTEWEYLFQNNCWTLGYIKTSAEDSSLCYMLVPNSFAMPEGMNVKILGTGYNSFKSDLEVPSDNSYTVDQFKKLENLGVVALPCGGYRDSTSLYSVGLSGNYWSSTAHYERSSSSIIFYYVSKKAYGLSFNSEEAYSGSYNYRNYGQSVRLVQDRNLDIRFVNADGSTLLDTTVLRGTKPTYTREVPTKDSSTDYTYHFKGWNKEIVEAECDMVYTAVYDSTFIMKKNGAIRYAYKISAKDSVYFSQGNLQFTTLGTHKTADGTAQGTWRFAENQWDAIGYVNMGISDSCDTWIDLFGWGTSGWESEANAYQPWSRSEKSSDYYPGGSSSNDLTGTYANADWGVYNAISNGGNEPNKWRTLTNAEWEYLFQNNKWTLGYIKTTEEDSSLCFMLIPETFTAPEGITVTVLSTTTTSTSMKVSVPSTNKYTTEQFASLEKTGVVALPCGGSRYGTSVTNVGSLGYYWSSSAYGSNYAYVFRFSSTRVNSINYNYRRDGRSVRLARDL